MPINLPANFENDIQGRDTALVPLIKIGDLYVSTNNMVYDGNPVLPLLLSNPSLKESIDIEKRNYKISNITLSLSNFPYNGNRFSDSVSGSLINEEVKIYWVSPSTTNFEGDTSALIIYQGQVRRYDHDEETVKITVEDRSQATLHKPLPTTILDPEDESVPDKYKNKPVPMVYGSVDKSPCVISSYEDNEYTLIPDNVILDDSIDIEIENYPYSIAGYPNSKSYLYINRDNVYCSILPDIDPQGISLDIANRYDYEDGEQYSLSANSKYITIFNKLKGDNTVAGAGGGVNPIGNNEALAYFRSVIQTTRIFNSSDNYQFDGDFGGINQIINWTFPDGDSGWYRVLWDGNPNGISGDPRIVESHQIQWTFAQPPLSSMGEYYTYVVIFGNAYFQNHSFDNDDMGMWIFYRNYNPNEIKSLFFAPPNGGNQTYHGNQTDTFASLYETTTPAWKNLPLSSAFIETRINGMTSNQSGSVDMKLSFNNESSYTQSFFILDKFIESDFYAKITGRQSDTPQPPEIISNILTKELGQNINITSTNYTDWQYAFTVN